MCGQSFHLRPGADDDLRRFLRRQVAGCQREQDDAGFAQGRKFVRLAADVLITRQYEPAAPADFAQLSGVGRVVGEMIAMRFERDAGVTQRGVQLAAPGVTIDEEDERLRRRGVAQSAALLR